MARCFVSRPFRASVLDEHYSEEVPQCIDGRSMEVIPPADEEVDTLY